MMHLATVAELEASMCEAVCCRSWPVLPGVPLRACGYCGEVPRIIGPWTDKVGESSH